MWMLPLYLHVNQKSDYDDMMMYIICVVSPDLSLNCSISGRPKGNFCQRTGLGLAKEMGLCNGR